MNTEEYYGGCYPSPNEIDEHDYFNENNVDEFEVDPDDVMMDNLFEDSEVDFNE